MLGWLILLIRLLIVIEGSSISIDPRSDGLEFERMQFIWQSRARRLCTLRYHLIAVSSDMCSYSWLWSANFSLYFLILFQFFVVLLLEMRWLIACISAEYYSAGGTGFLPFDNGHSLMVNFLMGGCALLSLRRAISAPGSAVTYQEISPPLAEFFIDSSHYWSCGKDYLVRTPPMGNLEIVWSENQTDRLEGFRSQFTSTCFSLWVL